MVQTASTMRLSLGGCAGVFVAQRRRPDGVARRFRRRRGLAGDVYLQPLPVREARSPTGRAWPRVQARGVAVVGINSNDVGSIRTTRRRRWPAKSSSAATRSRICWTRRRRWPRPTGRRVRPTSSSSTAPPAGLPRPVDPSRPGSAMPVTGQDLPRPRRSAGRPAAASEQRRAWAATSSGSRAASRSISIRRASADSSRRRRAGKGERQGVSPPVAARHGDPPGGLRPPARQSARRAGGEISTAAADRVACGPVGALGSPRTGRRPGRCPARRRSPGSSTGPSPSRPAANCSGNPPPSARNVVRRLVEAPHSPTITPIPRDSASARARCASSTATPCPAPAIPETGRPARRARSGQGSGCRPQSCFSVSTASWPSGGDFKPIGRSAASRRPSRGLGPAACRRGWWPCSRGRTGSGRSCIGP